MNVTLRTDPLREHIRSSLWFLPSISVTAAILLGLALVGADNAVGADRPPFNISAEGARSVLEVVAGSTLTVMSLMYSLTIVALQIASDQYSPRLLRTFLRDVGNQIVLSVFLATFAYCLVVLPNIRTGGAGTEVVPPTAFSVVGVLAVATLASLVYFIHHIAQSIRIDTIMKRVERDTLAAINRNFPHQVAGQEWNEPLPEIPAVAEPIPASRSGFVRTVNPEALAAYATDRDLVIVFEQSIGEHVVAGIPLAWAWRRGSATPIADPEAIAARVNAATSIGTERSLLQDVEFGLRQLVDIAVKAASEASVDPATAADAISHIAVILARLAQRRLSHTIVTDAQRVPRVGIPRRDFAAYLDLGTSEIRRHRIDDTEVPRMLLQMLGDVGRLCPTDQRREAVTRQIDIVADDAVGGITVPADRELLHGAAAAARAAVEAGRRRRAPVRDLPQLPFA